MRLRACGEEFWRGGPADASIECRKDYCGCALGHGLLPLFLYGKNWAETGAILQAFHDFSLA